MKSSTTEIDGLSTFFTKKSLTGTTALLVYLAIADFLVHMFFSDNYGYFRDELYYIVSGTQHLSLGYVDFPPLVAYIAALLYPISKDSLVSIHVVSALVASTTVIVVGMIARELGGGRKAQLLAAVCTLVTLAFLADGSEFSPDAFDQLWWALLAYVMVRIVHRKEAKSWFLAGLVVGIGLLSKLTIFFFVGALLISFLAIPSSRKYLRSKWVIVGGLLSLVFILPMIYWNLTNGWPMVQFYLEFRGDVGGGGPVNFFVSQLGQTNPLNIPVAIAGLYFFLRSNQGKEFRTFGLTFLILYGFMTIIDMKPYYLAPAYSMLFAGGALVVEKSSITMKGVSRWLGSRPYIACLLILTILLAPIVMPILSPATLIKTYGTSTLSSANSNVASGESGPLPQNLGDRFGWNTMVSTLAQAYTTLPANEERQACIFASNYGEASAVNFLGKSLGLPEAISGHNSYFIWGPDSCTGQVLITVGVPLTSVNSVYKNVSLLTTITCQYCMDLENNLPVYLCLNPNFTSLTAEWQLVKQYD
ncbi:MAG TPA: glycosyltransferase family 39 protein [Nitrososphaerales archaeon]|nr:glycosyltransferase family 39 protein [Nitrososphaerales archaeon]